MSAFGTKRSFLIPAIAFLLFLLAVFAFLLSSRNPALSVISPAAGVGLASVLLFASLLAYRMERKSIDKMLRLQEVKSRTLIERIPAIVYQVQFGSSVQWRYLSPRIKSILGFTAEEWMADPQLWFKQIHPQDREEVLAKGMNSSLSGKPFICEYRMYTRDCRLVWLRDEGNVVKDPEKKSALIQGVMLDITERKQAEILQNVLYRLTERTNAFQNLSEYYSAVHQCIAELMDARNFYIALFDSSSQSFSFPYSVSERTFSMDAQNCARGLPGYVITKGPLLADAETLADLTKRGEVLDDGVPFISWLGVPLKSNEKTLGMLSVQSFSHEKKYDYADLHALLLLAAEVATTLEQKRAKKELQEKSAQLQTSNSAMTVFLNTNNWMSASDVILKFVIRETESQYGFIAVSNGPGLKIVAQEGVTWDQNSADIKSRCIEFDDLRNLFGSVITQAAPIISNDPSSDPRSFGCVLESQPPLCAFLGVPMKHANEVFGLVGVANRTGGYSVNEFKKIELLCETSAVLSHATWLSQEQKQSRSEIPQKDPELISLNEILENMQDLLTGLLGDTELIVNCQPDLGLVKADPGQIEQVIMNLALNARDAMPQSGELILETYETQVGEHNSHKSFGIPCGSYVVLRIKDTGDGISEGTLKAIFEPFFNKTDSGVAGGSRLAMVYQIIKQSGGHINVQSDLGSGNTFEIYLPLVEQRQGAISSSVTSRIASPEVPGSARTILLVDNNEVIRKATSALLMARGFQVLEASNGPEAVALADNHKGSIDLLITDVVMPRMSGASLAQNILIRRPNTKVLFVSGYSEETVVHQTPAATFLQKPFSTGTFFGRIKELLNLSDQTA